MELLSNQYPTFRKTKNYSIKIVRGIGFEIIDGIIYLQIRTLAMSDFNRLYLPQSVRLTRVAQAYSVTEASCHRPILGHALR